MSAVLIRRTVVQADGTRERVENELDVAKVTIGSSPDSVIQLPGLPVRHAEFSIGRRRATLRVFDGRHARVDGSERRRARVRTGTKIEFDGHVVEILQAPAGFDLALDVQPAPPSGKSDSWSPAFPTSLQAAGLSKRRWVWRLSGLVVALSLVIPFFFSQLVPRSLFPAARAFTDSIWSTGALADVHHFAPGEECSNCHTTLFHRVKDVACKQCHDQINDHADVATLIANDFRTDRCATCHREHNVPSTLLETGDQGCISCHSKHDGIKSPSGVVPEVGGFAKQTHPQLKITFPVLGEVAGVPDQWTVRVTSIVGASDASNLRFPHKIHLDADKVSDARSDEILSCTSCHEPATDGEHFLPVEMEGSCAACHPLGFDDSDPQRRLPHGDAEEAIRVMEGHFLKNVFSPPPRPLDGFKWRRIPDRPPRYSGDCSIGDVACAKQMFAEETKRQFEVTGCVTCHVVETTKNAHLADHYRVVPVKLAEDYLPKARFDHTAHRVIDDKTGEQACLSCHAADRSQKATDVLIPPIETCFRCHGDASVRSRATVTCIDCHGYHPPHPALRPGNET